MYLNELLSVALVGNRKPLLGDGERRGLLFDVVPTYSSWYLLIRHEDYYVALPT